MDIRQLENVVNSLVSEYKNFELARTILDSFEDKLKTIKETAFTKETPKGTQKLEEETAPAVPSNERISKYVDAISKNLKF